MTSVIYFPTLHDFHPFASSFPQAKLSEINEDEAKDTKEKGNLMGFLFLIVFFFFFQKCLRPLLLCYMPLKSFHTLLLSLVF